MPLGFDPAGGFAPTWSFPSGVSHVIFESFAAAQVLVVLDVVVPAHRLVFGRLQMEGGHLLVVAVAAVFAGLEEEHLVSGAREVRGERSAAGARADDDVLVSR